jgi:hypothetical protein
MAFLCDEGSLTSSAEQVLLANLLVQGILAELAFAVEGFSAEGAATLNVDSFLHP